MIKINHITPNHEILKIDLTDTNDRIVVFDPSSIVGFQSSNLQNREDKTDFKFKFKPDWKKSYVHGVTTLYVKSSNNAKIELLEVNKDTPFIFRANIFLHTDGIDLTYEIEKQISNVFFLDRAFLYECTGNGTIAYYVEGEGFEITLQKGESIFVHPNNVVGFDKYIKYELNTYGTFWKTALKMDYHYKFTGEGKIKLQTQSFLSDMKEYSNKHDGFFKRAFHNFVPGGSLFWR